jgi:transducin (beta)-like 1
MQENGFSHTAFTFANESLVSKSTIAYTEVPPGALITFLQKGLEYVGIEEHIGEDGTIREFENSSHSLLSPFICDAIAVKEDRRIRKITANGSGSTTATPSNANAMDVEPEAASSSSGQGQGLKELAPSSVIIKGEPTVGDPKKWLHLSGHTGEVFICAWNPIDNQLASGSADGYCRLWNLSDTDGSKWDTINSQVSIRSSMCSHTSYVGERFKDVTSISWSPDGSLLATGCYDGVIRLWDKQGVLKCMLHEHTGPIFSLKWSKCGLYLLSGSHDRQTIVWNPLDGTTVKKYIQHTGPVFDVDWLNDEIFATGSADKTIIISTVSSSDNKPLAVFTGHLSEINTIRWSPDGKFLASCSDDGTAKVWSIDNGLVYNLQGHTKEIYTLRWSCMKSSNSMSMYLCTASFDGTVKIWDSNNGKEIYSLSRHNQAVYSIAPSPNGELIAVGSLGGYVSVWKLSDGTLSSEFRGTGDTFDVNWSHDGKLLSSCYSSGSLRIVDTGE